MRKSGKYGIGISVIIALWFAASVIFKSALSFIVGSLVISMVWPLLAAVIFWIIWDQPITSKESQSIPYELLNRMRLIVTWNSGFQVNPLKLKILRIY